MTSAELVSDFAHAAGIKDRAAWALRPMELGVGA
jgi:hypothetical protein